MMENNIEKIKREATETLGTSETNHVVARHRRLAFVPPATITHLAQIAMQEPWGKDLYALEKYVSVTTPWSIEQGRFSAHGDQFYVTAGHLRTRYGTQIYLVYERNRHEHRQPWVLKLASSEVRAPFLPEPPAVPELGAIPPGAEIELRHEHMLDRHSDRVQFLKSTPRVAQMCAIAGAIQWSLNRKLHWPYIYYGRLNHVVPVYLSSREETTGAPDLVAPIQVTADRLLVRTLLPPYSPYPNARVAVERADELPSWLIAAWRLHAETATESEIDDPEDGED